LSIFDSVVQFALNILDQAGYLGIFFLMVLESATLPVPSEVVLPLVGYLVFQGQIEFWLAVIVASIGSIVGTLIDFAIGYYLGRPAILRYGKVIRLSEKHLITTEKWFTKYGPIVVLLARFVPLIRTLVAFPAGVAKMNLAKFIAYSFVGIFVWDAVLIYLGDQVGANYSQIVNSLHNYFTPIEIAAVILSAVVIFLVYRRSLRTKGLPEEKKRPEPTKDN
jgi:membrane protein DedA with SNARE-associated domain